MPGDQLGSGVLALIAFCGRRLRLRKSVAFHRVVTVYSHTAPMSPVSSADSVDPTPRDANNGLGHLRKSRLASAHALRFFRCLVKPPKAAQPSPRCRVT